MLNNSGESGHPCLVPNLRGTAFNFSPLKIKSAVGLSYMAFTMLSYLPSISIFWRVLIINCYWILSKAFSASIEIQFSSVTQSCSTLFDPMNCSTPGLPVHLQLPEFIQTNVHWFGDAIQPPHPLSSPSPPALKSFPASGSFQMSQVFASGGQSIGVSASTSVFPMNIQDWSPLGWTGWISLESKGLSRVFSNTTVQKCSLQFNYSALRFLYSPTLTSIHDHWKNHSLD